MQHWRENNIRKSLGSHSNPGAGGICIEPIWQLLKAKRTEAGDSTWGEAEKGALRSLVTNRQYPQVRCKAAGWTTHDKCIACVHRISIELGCQCNLEDAAGVNGPATGRMSKLDAPAAISAAATAEVLSKAPIGPPHHRAWICKTLDGPRLKEAQPQDIGRTKDGWGTGDPAWERALAPRPPLPIVKQSQCETFHWVVRPPDGILPPGDVYVDGSALDGPYRQLIRCGWAFVMTDRNGRLIAAARGVPPPWIDDIGGAE